MLMRRKVHYLWIWRFELIFDVINHLKDEPTIHVGETFLKENIQEPIITISASVN